MNYRLLKVRKTLRYNLLQFPYCIADKTEDQRGEGAYLRTPSSLVVVLHPLYDITSYMSFSCISFFLTSLLEYNCFTMVC